MLTADQLKVGARLRDGWRTGIDPTAKGHLWHVRGFVDDQAVLRCWSYHKKRWIYVLVTDHGRHGGLIGYRRDGEPPTF